MSEAGYLLKSFMALFTVIDPVGGAPFFLSITEGYSSSERKKIAFRASLTLFFTLELFLWIGKNLLEIFQISIFSFKIAGGILLFVTAMEMLFGQIRHAKTSVEEASQVRRKEDVSIVPLGIPYLAGPGAITTTIILAENAQTLHKIELSFVILANALVTFLLLSQAERIFKILGELGTKAIVRILGLILASIAVEYITSGLKQIF